MKSIRNFQWMNEQMTDHLPTSTGRTLGQKYKKKKKKKKKNFTTSDNNNDNR